jgi:hypothetical protein
MCASDVVAGPMIGFLEKEASSQHHQLNQI